MRNVYSYLAPGGYFLFDLLKWEETEECEPVDLGRAGWKTASVSDSSNGGWASKTCKLGIGLRVRARWYSTEGDPGTNL